LVAESAVGIGGWIAKIGLGHLVNRRKRKKEFLEEHQRHLVNDVLRQWFENNPIEIGSFSTGDARSLVYKVRNYNVFYNPHNMTQVPIPKEPEIIDTGQAIKHLETGYQADWIQYKETLSRLGLHLQLGRN
jgi:hypothetical protein